MTRCLILLWSAVLLFSAGCSKPSKRTSAERVDLALLLERMTNVTTFAEAPLGNSFMESSYDRTGGNQDWMVYPKSMGNQRITIFDAEGPGYVSRFWIASFAAERWLFFFDGEEKPRLDLAKDDLFGECFPFVAPLSGKSGGGRYCLMPIPFSKHLRIEMISRDVLTSRHRNYYQINFTKLDMEPEAVQSFPAQLSPAESNLVSAVNAVFDANDEILENTVHDMLKDAASSLLAPGKSIAFWKDRDAGLLKSFCIRIDEPVAGEALAQELLRGLRLQLFWDGSDKPSVDVPLGDFFCNPWYFRSYSSLPLGRVDNAFVCRFPMPYLRGARCEIKNLSGHPISLSVGAQGNRKSNEGLSRTFHAKWNASTRTGRPLEFVEVDGAGHYVGCFLSAIGQDGSWTILEGDEFIEPDPGVQPPQLGTGLEDYFNGAYYYTSLFDLPFHGLIEKGAMRTDQYRLHMLDAVAFDHSFRAGIEFGDQNHAKGYMSSMVYWYADKTAPVPLPADTAGLLARPNDRFEVQGLMAQLLMLERDGLFKDAGARMDFFAKRYKDQPWSDLLNVRALGYRENAEGFDAVRDGYVQLARSSFEPAAQAAKDAIWLHEEPTNALLGIHALARYRLKLDDRVVAEGEGKNGLTVHRLSVVPGEHVWEVELAPTRQGSFFALCLRSAVGETTAAGEWEVLSMQENMGQKRPDLFARQRVLPNMTLWAFQPNAYINMQRAPIITIWNFFESAPLLKQVVLRKPFTFGEGQPENELIEDAERSEDELRTHAIN